MKKYLPYVTILGGPCSQHESSTRTDGYGRTERESRNDQSKTAVAIGDQMLKVQNDTIRSNSPRLGEELLVIVATQTTSQTSWLYPLPLPNTECPSC